jgi:signal transduction histidine kinase
VHEGDVAALQVANEQLCEANAQLSETVAELEAFAAVVSHDLKSPLTSMTGYLQLLANLSPAERDSTDYDECLAGIIRCIETMRVLIDDLFTFATAPDTPLRRVEVDLDQMVREIIGAWTSFPAAQPTRRPKITVDPLPQVLGDPTMLRRVFENLLDNSVKYTPEGKGAVIHISATRDLSGVVRVELADEGIGIPEGQHDAVFEQFHRAHRDDAYPGTGLGLAICERIVTRHGGEIGARPNRGGGTRIWFTLPNAR